MKIRSKPTETEAIQFDGSHNSARQIQAWAHQGLPAEANEIIHIDATDVIRVRTNNGFAFAKAGDWIIKGPSDFYPCDAQTFAKRWEPVSEIETYLKDRMEHAFDAPPTRYLPTSRNCDKAIDRRFAHHPPKNDQGQRYGEIRAHLREAAKFIRDRTPESPEQTRAFNALHEAMMLANAAIACNE